MGRSAFALLAESTDPKDNAPKIAALSKDANVGRSLMLHRKALAGPSGQHVEDGVLHLFNKNGEMADEKHLGSYPLANIRRWQRFER